MTGSSRVKSKCRFRSVRYRTKEKLPKNRKDWVPRPYSRYSKRHSPGSWLYADEDDDTPQNNVDVVAVVDYDDGVSDNASFALKDNQDLAPPAYAVSSEGLVQRTLDTSMLKKSPVVRGISRHQIKTTDSGTSPALDGTQRSLCVTWWNSSSTTSFREDCRKLLVKVGCNFGVAPNFFILILFYEIISWVS